MKMYSQNDNMWKKDPLGFAKHGQTIGSHGCTISDIGMLAELTPREVNERLKSVGGFSESLVLWNKIHEAIPWLDFEWRGYTYDNNAVLSAIKRFGGCLVEVDGAPIGGVKHWVTFTGNHKLFDPFDGKEKNTGVYKPTGYAVIKVLPKPSEVDPLDKIISDIHKTCEESSSNVSKIDRIRYLLSLA